MGSLLAGGNKKAKANQNIRGEWDFCLKRLSAPTKTLPLLFEAHTHAGCWAKNNELGISVIL